MMESTNSFTFPLSAKFVVVDAAEDELVDGSFDGMTSEEKSAYQYLNDIDDDEFDILFPDTDDDTVNEVKWLFGVGAGFALGTLNERRKNKKKKKNEELEGKSAKKPLRDPEGGLTAEGRKHFNNTEGSNLKPGVTGPADTPTKMRRKGSFLVRFFTNPSGPMVDEKGKPTRLALSAHAWGEPVPGDMKAAAKLAAKGRSLLDRYRKLQDKKK